MTLFLRLLDAADKEKALVEEVQNVRNGSNSHLVFSLDPDSFRRVPTSPFAYWVSEFVRGSFSRFPALNSSAREAWMGLSTGANFQWLRLYWEVPCHLLMSQRSDAKGEKKWAYVAKGGEFATFYQKVHVVVDWQADGHKLGQWKLGELEMGRTTENNSKCWNQTKYFRPGVTWSARSQKGASFRVLPPNCIFGSKGPAILTRDNDPDSLLALTAITNSSAFSVLLSIQMAFGSYEVGVIQRTPVPKLADQQAALASMASRAWSLTRALDSIDEISHAFMLPATLRLRQGDFDPPTIGAELARIQAEVDSIAYKLYGFSEADRAAVQASHSVAAGGDSETEADDERDEEESAAPIDQRAGLLSWAVGVIFGRFDWRLATGERAAATEPEPFDPLPAKSPGMLPDGAAPFHANAGILVDSQGHPHDLARLMEEVLARVEVPVPEDVRQWLQRDFFAFHLQRYSKSRRKAPIYWPLATRSGSYTLWVYYPSLTSQTLYTAINDFIEPKLKQSGAEVTALRSKGSGRTRDEEKQFESLQAFELELIELRDALLGLAPAYKPNHDDGVQINAAPLWPLFRHKPWQKLLKETWAKLEKGDFDWAQLAMSYWPDRVREKSKNDKSLAIAHGLESLYVASEATPNKIRGKKQGAKA